MSDRTRNSYRWIRKVHRRRLEAISDARTSEELVEVKLKKGVTKEEKDQAGRNLYYRGGLSELRLIKSLVSSKDFRYRTEGAYLIGWGFNKKQFRKTRLELVLNGLRNEKKVNPLQGYIKSAEEFLPDKQVIDSLLELGDHPSSWVRYCLAESFWGLGHIESIRRVLIQLMRDSDKEVRDWATFGLALGNMPSLINHLGSYEIRMALLGQMDDPYPIVRAEAICGLAERGDPAGIPFLIRDLESEDIPAAFLDAASKYASPKLLPSLLRLRERFEDTNDSWDRWLGFAIRDCQAAVDWRINAQDA